MVLRITLIIIGLFLSTYALAQSPKQQAAEAYKLYTDSALESSAELYEKSLSLSPNAEYLFNLGNSYLKLGDQEKARKAYEGTLNSSSSSNYLKSKSAYNLGNLEYAEKEYGKAIEYYKNALLNNPEDVQASENLQIALAQMQMQEQQQQQQEEQQQQQENSDEDNQDEQPQNSEEENEENSDENQDQENSSGEEEKTNEQPSQSTKLSKEQAEEFFKRLDSVENQTKSRLNDDLLKEKGTAQNKTITKDW